MIVVYEATDEFEVGLTTGHTPSCAYDCHTILEGKASRLLSRADPDNDQLRSPRTCQASSCQRSDWPSPAGTVCTPTGRTECCTCRGHTECTTRLPPDSCNPDRKVDIARMTWHESEADSIPRGFVFRCVCRLVACCYFSATKHGMVLALPGGALDQSEPRRVLSHEAVTTLSGTRLRHCRSNWARQRVERRVRACGGQVRAGRHRLAFHESFFICVAASRAAQARGKARYWSIRSHRICGTSYAIL